MTIPSDSISVITENDDNASITSEDHISAIDDESEDDNDDNSDTEYETDDEVDPAISPLILEPVPSQTLLPNIPIKLDVISSEQVQPSYLPLCVMLNARSLYNKRDNFKNLLYQIGPDLAIVSETWERQRQSLDNLLSSEQFKIVSFKRNKVNNRQPGGGCALVYNDKRFKVTQIDLKPPDGVEACWALFSPLNVTPHHKVKKLVTASIYVSPRSHFKDETVEHIIQSIHFLRSKFDNDVSFLIGGDLNKLEIGPIMDSYGALKQLISVPTRKSATLSNIITDLCNLYHPPTTLPALQVDEGKKGSDSDHQVVIFAPISNQNYLKPRCKKTITVRPLPQSAIDEFGKIITSHGWEEVLNERAIDVKVKNFHTTLRNNLDKFFPEKTVKISTLDKKWMNPSLKVLHRQVQREFFKNRQSKKWKKLKSKFKKKKRKAVKLFYSKFVNELKETDPGRWYKMAKQIGAVDQMNGGDLIVEELEGLSSKESADVVAQHFAEVSNEYQPLNYTDLPTYLPGEKPPQVDEHAVYEKINKLKNTRSTFDIDIPNKLRKEFSPELSTPLSDIINSCLMEQYYPKLWKYEAVTPVPKVTHPKTVKDLRKVSSTSDFSKVFESFLRDWILEDISGKIDIGQFGGQAGKGTEHMMVFLVDRILKLLDRTTDRAAVIATMVDWSNAFDRQDPTLAIEKFLKMGVRPSLVPVLASYLSDRQMQVKYNGTYSSTYQLPGGGPQGTLVGLIEYFVQSNDNADCVDPGLRFKYVDDLTILELVMLGMWLSEYNFKQHVSSDIGIDEKFVDPSNLKTQANLNTIADWTNQNQMKLNETKTNYMVFSRSETEIATRLTVNSKTIDRIEEIKLVGVWLTTWLDWDKNTREICKKAYARMTMLTKLKYAGVHTDELINIYILYIRSLLEYCSVVWHSTLTAEQTHNIERVQKLCLKIILGSEYEGYDKALECCGLERLTDRRQQKCLNYGLKSLLHPVHSEMFPVNPQLDAQNTRNQEHFTVNWARTDSYRMSAVPYIQRMLNDYVNNQQSRR